MFRYTPFYPATQNVHFLSEDILKDSSSLYGSLANAPETFQSIVNLVRRVNSYYSNLIEGSDTSPYAVEEAMREIISDKPEQRLLQEESVSHILVTAEIEEALKSNPQLNVASPDFIQYIHRRFYENMPSAPRAIKGDGVSVELIPGVFRRHHVKVSEHIAPDPGDIEVLMRDFAKVYEVGEELTTSSIPKIAAAHHRFVFCHPFLDGNGRTGRILTEAMLQKAGVKGHSLWSVSRGLARNESDYKQMLSAADSDRRGSLDGRGVLSQEGLDNFSVFFLEAALDQIHYMHNILSLNNIKQRIDVYVNNVRASNINLKEGVLSKLRPEVAGVLKSLFLNGRLARGEVSKLTGFGERTSSDIIKGLINEGLAVPMGGSHKSDLRLGFTPHLTINLFPDLYPQKYLTLDNSDHSSLMTG